MAGKSTVTITFKVDGDNQGFKNLAQNADGLRTAMNSALKSANELKASLINWSAAAQGLQSIGNAVNQINNQLNSLTAESEQFNKAMRAANTMAGKGEAGFKALKGEIADLAKEIPLARDLLANGLYQTISNGVSEDNWIEYLTTSARSAVGGMADINQVVGVTSTVIKNYGLQWSAAADIQDKIQLTAKNGVTSFEQLAAALPRVTGNAATLGVTVDELLGTFATLTGVSGNTAEVSTQLAAVFTALVKPSSEATKMAAEMGIQFDAAAIKAAGGFQAFLTSLDQSVKTYAQTSGMLEQEVYGRLFGSAESLRALIPLQGELSAKFASNISDMVNSAGTMDQAFDEMNSHTEAFNQRLRNMWASVMDAVAGVTATIQPYINFSSALLSTGSSMAILVMTFKQLNIQQLLFNTRAKLSSVAMLLIGQRGRSATAIMRVFSAALKGTAYQATAAKIALRGLMSATVIGSVFVALGAALEYFTGAADDATDSTNKLLDAGERAKRDAERLNELREQEASAIKDGTSKLELYIAKTKNFNGTQEEEKRLVNEINNAFGERMGYFDSAAKWYEALTKNSKKYCEQLELEARIQTLVNQIADKNNDIRQIRYNADGSLRQYSTKPNYETVYETDLKTGMTYATSNKRALPSDLDNANAQLRGLYADRSRLREELESLVQRQGQLGLEIYGSATPSKSPVTPTPTATPDPIKAKTAEYNAEASNLQGYYDNITALQEQLRTATIERAAEINKEIALWREKARAIEDAGKVEEQATERVYDANANTLRGIEDNIAIQQERLKDATKEEAVFINRSIALWKEKADEIRDAGFEIAEAVEEENEAVAESNRNILGGFQGVYGGVRGVADSVTRLTSALDDNASAWEKIITSIDTVFSLINGVGSVMSALTMFRDTSKEIAAAKTTEAVATGMATAAGAAQATEAVAQVTALAGIGTAANATANAEMQLAGATTLAAHAYIPFAGVGIASGLIMSGLSLVQNLHPFAKGGIISGPTLGLLGEYAGAPNNPEVVAPLDKLRSLLPSTGGGVMTAKVRGRDLVLATSNETRASSRSGRRSNIRL